MISGAALRGASRAAACAVALAAGLPAASAAENLGPVVVLLLAGHDAEPLAGRLAAELAAVGFEVRREEPPAEMAPEPVAAAMRAGATAAVWALPGAAAAEVWIIDRTTGRAVIRQSITAEGDEMAPLVALRTVEFLRASLLGRLPGPAPAAPPAVARTEPAAVLPAAAAPGPPRLSTAVGAALTDSAGGIGALSSIAVALRARVAGALGIEVLGLLPVTTPRVSDPSSNAATVSVWLAGAGLTLRTPERRPGWLDAGAGGMAIFVSAAGQPASSQLQGLSQTNWGTALYARGGAGLALGPWLGLRAEGLLGAAIQRPVICFGDFSSPCLTRAPWGRPFASAILALEARWP